MTLLQDLCGKGDDEAEFRAYSGSMQSDYEQPDSDFMRIRRHTPQHLVSDRVSESFS
jgi:hypothetical protein